MRVWIDQDLCTGDGLCVDHCPDVFVQLEDGIAYVAEHAVPLNDPGGPGSLAWVPLRHHRRVIEAADVCPGECIFIEVPATGELEPLEPFADDDPDVDDLDDLDLDDPDADDERIAS